MIYIQREPRLIKIITAKNMSISLPNVSIISELFLRKLTLCTFYLYKIKYIVFYNYIKPHVVYDTYVTKVIFS